MITSHFIPPHSPDALAIAHTLLAIAADPAGCKARLDELMRVRADAQDAVRALEDQGTRNRKELESVAGLRARENAVAAKELELQAASTRMAVASSAHSEREAQLSRRQSDLQNAIKQHEAAVAAHVRRVEQAKAALG